MDAYLTWFTNIFECNCKCISIIFTCIWAIAAILTGILISYSIGSIDLNQVALKFDSVNFRFDNSTVYLPGRYWTGLGTYFITFPSNIQEISFSKNNLLFATTSNPQNIYIELSILYYIRPEFLQSLFLQFPNGNYQTYLTNLAISTVQQVTSNYSASDFIVNRDSIQQAVSDKLSKSFRSAYFNLYFVKLGEVTFDDNFEDYILKKLTSQRNYISYQLNQTVDIIQGQSNLLSSQTSLNALQNLNNAKASGSNAINNANSIGDMNLIMNQATSLIQFTGTLNFTQQELNKFLLYEKLVDTNSFLKKPEQNSYSFGMNSINFGNNN